MFFAFARRAALGSAVAVVAACSSHSALAPVPGADAGGDAPNGLSVAFDDAVVKGAPTQPIDVGISVTGPDTSVAVWLEGDYSDASLTEGTVTTTSGHAKLTLHAPSIAATFGLRARVKGATDARVDVSISAAGYATVRVLPKYDGRRPFPSAAASIFVKTTCGDLAKADLHDGFPRGEGAAALPIVLANVPAGSHVAIMTRIEFYASGCVDVDSLVPNHERDVTLPLFDRPMALDQTNLEASFSFEPAAADLASWTKLLDAAIAKASTAFVPDAAREPALVLDAMRAAVPAASQGAFDAARTQNGWDARAATWLAQRAPGLRDRALAWMNAGKASGLANLVAHLSAGPSTGYAAVTLTSFGKLEAGSAGMEVRSPFDWAADADDTVHLSGTVHIAPTALVARLGDDRAATDVPAGTDVASALGVKIDCAGLATSLVGAGTSYPSCDAACTASLCGAGLGAMWKAAASASANANEDAQLGMTASAPAMVGAHAEPIQFTGSWVGQVGKVNGFGMKGTAKGLFGAVPR